MSRIVKLDTEDLRERRAQEPAAPCEAERRNLMALYELELDWGAGRFDYAKIKRILTGRDQEACTCGAERMSA